MEELLRYLDEVIARSDRLMAVPGVLQLPEGYAAFALRVLALNLKDRIRQLQATAA